MDVGSGDWAVISMLREQRLYKIKVEENTELLRIQEVVNILADRIGDKFLFESHINESDIRSALMLEYHKSGN